MRWIYCCFLIVIEIGIFLPLCSAEEVTILDTRNATSDLGWPTSGGWAELTDTDESDADLRTFQVCRIRWSNQNNWLRTPYLVIGSAQRIFVEVRFTIRSCEGLRRIVSCKETFNLYYLPSDSEDEARAAHMNERTYTKVDTIAADQRFSRHTMDANTETRAIPSLKTRGLYLAFQDTGACMSIMYVRVYYKTCSQTLRELAWFPVTVTGPEMTSLVDVTGTCVTNSVQLKHRPAPTLHCGSDGQWLVPSGSCQCKAGYEANEEMSRCDKCGVGTFKPTEGNSPCLSCPPHSFSIGYGSTMCRCSSGYFKAPGDSPHAPCSQPPGKPKDAEAFVNKTSVLLKWSAPDDQTVGDDLTYSVSCDRCGSFYSHCTKCGKTVDYLPRKSRLTSGTVRIDNLLPHTNYRFKIYSFNGVSSLSSDKPKHVQLRIRTNKNAPPTILPAKVLSAKESTALVQWEGPSDPESPIVEYQLQYSSGKNALTNHTKQTKFKLEHLDPATSYVVKVRAKNSAGYGLYSRPTAFRTKSLVATESPAYFNDGSDHAPPSDVKNEDSSTHGGATDTRMPSNNEHLVVAVVVACCLLIITLALLAFVCGWKKRFVKKSIMDVDKYPGFVNTSVDLVSTRTYVDPSTYGDPYQAVEEFAKEIDHKLVHIDRVIGRGEFGEVCKGVLEPEKRSVAIKTLKVGYSNQEKLDFLSEASIMGQFDHPNVIRLDGVVTRSRPLMIITEYMENGSLDTYLKDHQGTLPAKQLAQILHDVASGMNYLNGMGYIHRDLAARNVLVTSGVECKVSDFGLSRFLEEVTDDEHVAMYTTRGGMIPIRWTAPEAITKRTFSSCSDVWSYGIVMWEVLSFGERPYWEMSNPDVVHFVESGYRLPPPCFCPRVFHKLMLECWKYDLTQRPTFSDLLSVLQHFLQEPECLQDTLNRRSTRCQDECIPEMLDLSSLGQWLEEVHLLHYKTLMLRHGCVTAEQIIRLKSDELQEMGITNSNDIDTILREAEILNYKIEQVNNVSIAV